MRNIAKRVSISPAALVRHKSHVAGAIAKAQERREERIGDGIFKELRRVLDKAWELLKKLEAEGDTRGSVVALREARASLESIDAMQSRADEAQRERDKVSVNVINPYLEHIGGDSGSEPDTTSPLHLPEASAVKGQVGTETPNNPNLRGQLEPRPVSLSHAALPPSSPATEANSQSSEVAIVPPRTKARLVGAVGYLEGMR